MVEDCGDNRFFVRCKCGIAQDKLYWQRCDAVRRWNTRKPSADVQSVVRCKDCIYHIDRIDLCQAMPGQWRSNDYCCMGERKDG